MPLELFSPPKAPRRIERPATARTSNGPKRRGGCGGCGARKAEKHELPSVLKMAWNYVEATAIWRKNGRLVTTEVQYNERVRTCENLLGDGKPCPFLARVDGELRCLDCGCYVAEKAGRNARPGKSDCPKGHWPPLPRPNPQRPPRPPRASRSPTFRSDPPEPFTGPVTRHLLFHCAPYKHYGGAVWRQHAEQLRKRLHLFNGRRVVAIVTAPNMDKPDDVQRVYEGIADKFIVTPNVEAPLQLREVATHELLWSEIPLDDINGITFYAHTKGATKPVNPGVTVHRWGTMMYETLLDYPALIEETLQQYHCAGSFQKIGRFFARSQWHYSGTFYWIRNHQLARGDWRMIDRRWWGVEAWPALHFSAAQAKCIFYCRKGMNMYNMRDMLDAEKELEAWKKQNERYRTSS